MNTFTTWLAVLMLSIFVVMVYMAMGYPPGARMMPLVIGIPGILLCSFQLLLDFLNARHSPITDHFHSAPRAGEEQTAEMLAEAEDQEPEWGPETMAAELTIWTYFLIYISGVLLFGFLPLIPILVATYLWREAKVALPYALLAAAICLTLLYLLFETILQFELYRGYLAGPFLKSMGL